jgi:pyroglutamyl-peptidase
VNRRKQVLISAFEPYLRQKRNVSQDMLAELMRSPPPGWEIEPIVLPVEFGRGLDVLWNAVKLTRPRFVLSFGQADHGTAIRIERVAVNVRDTTGPDNAGVIAREQPILANAPIAYPTRLPRVALVDALAAQGLPAEISDSAGTYVCNDLFYGLMHRIGRSRCDIVAGFIHVPKRLKGVAPQDLAPVLAHAACVILAALAGRGRAL